MYIYIYTYMYIHTNKAIRPEFFSDKTVCGRINSIIIHNHLKFCLKRVMDC